MYNDPVKMVGDVSESKETSMLSAIKFVKHITTVRMVLIQIKNFILFETFEIVFGKISEKYKNETATKSAPAYAVLVINKAKVLSLITSAKKLLTVQIIIERIVKANTRADEFLKLWNKTNIPSKQLITTTIINTIISNIYWACIPQ